MVETITSKPVDKRKHFRWATIAAPPPLLNKDYQPPAIYHVHPASKDKNLIKRAKAKFEVDALAKEFIALNSPLKRKYQTTLNCSKVLIQKGKKFTSTYCNCKWCLICNNIRTGKLTNQYEDLSEYLKDSQFVTLTVRNIYRYDFATDQDYIQAMRSTQKQMYTFFRKIQDRFRKRGIPIKGIRNFENIPSQCGKGVHPHIHWQIDGTFDIADFQWMWTRDKLDKSTGIELIDKFTNGEITAGTLKGELIIALWMKHFPGLLTDRQGQQVKPCTAGTTKELFKYQTKLLVKIDGERQVPIRMLDMIFQATQGVKSIAITGFMTKRPRPDYLTIKDPDKKREAFEKFSIQAKEYMLYQSLTKALCADVNEDLESQESELSETMAVDTETGELVTVPEPPINVYVWRGDNWYCDFLGMRAINYKISNKTRKLIASFNSS